MAQPLHIPPKPAESAKMRAFFYRLALSSRFKRFFTFLVCLNSFMLFLPVGSVRFESLQLLPLQWSVEEEEGTQVLAFSFSIHDLTIASMCITVLFAFEIIFKMIAFTVCGFWQSKRNRIDLLITSFGLIWCLLHSIAVNRPFFHVVHNKNRFS